MVINKLVMLHRDRDRQQPLVRDRFPASAFCPSIPSFLLEQSRTSFHLFTHDKLLMPVIPISLYVLKSTFVVVTLSHRVAPCSHDHFAKHFMLHPLEACHIDTFSSTSKMVAIHYRNAQLQLKCDSLHRDNVQSGFSVVTTVFAKVSCISAAIL